MKNATTSTARTPCTQSDPDLWFGRGTAATKAKALCQGCTRSIFEACREEGWRHEFGVFGGLSSVDRMQIDPERYALAVRSERARASKADSHALRMLSLAIAEAV